MPLLWVGLALAFAGLGQLYFHLRLPVLDGLFFYALGLVAFWRALSWAPPLPSLRVAAPQELLALGQHARARAAALVATVLLGMTATALMAGVPPVHPYLLALGAGGVWIAVGLQLDGGVRESLGAWWRARRGIPHRDALAMAGLLLLAAGVRFYGLEELPFGLWYDEAAIGLEAQRVVAEPAYRPLYAPSTTSPAAHVYLVAAAEALFGKTVFAVRFIPALSGVFSVLLAYGLGRKLFGPSAGLYAAALMAVSRWDINFSRLGMQGATTPLFLLLVCNLALAAFSSGRATAYAALGVATGLLSWFYAANLLFPLVLLVPLLVLALGRADFRDGLRPRLVLVLGGALLTAAPVLLEAWRAPAALFSRPQSASVFRDKSVAEALPVLRESLGKHLAMFHYQGDANGRHNLPNAPMLDWATAVLLSFGLVAALKQRRDPRCALLLSWPFLMLLPGVLSLEFEAPQGLRSIGALPGALLLAALGLERMKALLALRLSPSYVGTLALVGLGVAALLNVATYFGPQAQDFAVWNAFSTAPSLLGRRLAEAGAPGGRYLLSAFYQGHPTVQFLAKTSYETLDPGRHLPLKGEVTTTLFLAPEEESVYQLVRSYYPEADCREERRRPRDPVVLYPCTVTAASQQATRGLIARYYEEVPEGEPTTLLKEAVVSAVVPSLGVSRTGSYRIEVLGSLLAPTHEPYSFTLAGPATVGLAVDGQELLSGGDQPTMTELAQGLHEVRLVGRLESPGAELRLLWQRSGGAWEAVPSQMLFHGNVRPLGLSGRYYAGEAWTGAPALRRTDGAPSVYFHVPPLPRPFSVEWTGSLFVQTPGPHRFLLSAISSARLELDGRTVVEAQEANVQKEGVLELAVGWHQVRLRYLAAAPYSQVFLRWQPPGKPRELVPPEALRPW